VVIYWYRSRRCHEQLQRFEGKTLIEALAAEAAGSAALAAAYAAPRLAPEKSATMADIITAYRAAPDGFLSLAQSTKNEWARHLDDIAAEFGDLPLAALKAKGIKSKFIAWRNSRASTPRKADYGIQVLNRLLGWAVGDDRIDNNPAAGIARLYKAGRADIIVEPTELDAILAHVGRHAGWMIRLAAATGIRRGDLVNLKWSDVGEDSIEFGTAKSRGMRRPIMPVLPEARDVIESLKAERQRLIDEGKVPSAFLLTTSRGTPWKEDSATQVFWRAAKELGIDKNLHDLRGTAVTRFILAGLSDEVVAELVGWETKRVRQVRRRYVDREVIARTIAAQLERKGEMREAT
jgi:integrase